MTVIRDSNNVSAQKCRAAQTTGPQLPVALTGLKQQERIELGNSGRRHQVDQLPMALTFPRMISRLSFCSVSNGSQTGEDILREYKHLMGTARYRTLRVHCLNLEHMMKAGLPIPWQERDLRAILNTLLEEEATPSKVNRLWYTLAWISKKLGLLEGDSLPRLVEKKRSILEQLATTVTRPQKKAAVPSLAVIQALERGATDDSVGSPQSDI